MPGKNLLLLTEKNILKYGSWFAIYCAVIHHMLPVPDKGLGTRQSTVSLRNISELYMQSSCFVLVPETLECMSPQRRGRREPVLYPCGTPTWSKMGKVCCRKVMWVGRENILSNPGTWIHFILSLSSLLFGSLRPKKGTRGKSSRISSVTYWCTQCKGCSHARQTSVLTCSNKGLAVPLQQRLCGS